MVDNITNRINKLEKKNKRHIDKFNKLKSKSNKLLEIYLSDKKLEKEKYKHSLCLLIIPAIIGLSFIIRSLYLCLATHIMVMASLSIGLGAIIIIPSVLAINDGYKGILSKRISNIDTKIMKMQTKITETKKKINNLKQVSKQNEEIIELIDNSSKTNNEIIIPLGRESVENIINDKTPFSDTIYRPVITEVSRNDHKAKKLVRKLTQNKTNNS